MVQAKDKTRHKRTLQAPSLKFTNHTASISVEERSAIILEINSTPSQQR